MRDESVCIGKEFNSYRIALVHQYGLRFIVLEVKMPCSSYPKAKAIQSRVRKQIIVLVLVIKARRLAYRRNKHDWCRFTRSVQNMHWGLRTADWGLRTADCGLGTTDCGLQTTDWVQNMNLGIKRGLNLRTGHKTRADSGIKWRLRTKCGLPTAVHVFY